ncbi:MAG: S9 family peptidase [Pseudomonadales bacterium]
MPHRLFLGLLGLGLAVSAPAFATDTDAETSLFTSARVFDLEYAADPQISPDGRTIVYARRALSRKSDRATGTLWSIDVRTGAQQPLLQDEKVTAGPRFSPDGERLVYRAGGALRILYLASGRSFTLAELERGPSAPVWSPDGTAIAFSMFVPAEAPTFATPPKAPKGADWAKPFRAFDSLVFRFDGQGYREKGAVQVFIVPAEGGTPRQITSGETPFSNPTWLRNDVLLVQGNDSPDRELDPIESEIYRVDLKTLAREPFIQRDGPDAAPTVAPNGQRVAYVGYDDKLKSYQQLDLYVADSEGGNGQNLTAEYDRRIVDFAWRGDSKALIALAETDGDLSLLTLPLRGKPSVITNTVGGTSLGRPYARGAFSVATGAGARPIIAFTAAASNRPAEVGVVRPGGNSRTLTSLNEDALGHLQLAKIEALTVESSHDQRDIEAWVALPPDFTADGSFPLILEIHGGPFTMYGPFFAAEIQRYAAEGYVTVYVNPRGSTGYGEEFSQLIDLAYPGNDYHDLMSVVDALIERKYADPERLFVTGGSGGGILTAWIVTQTDRFVAAAAIKPVINWTTMALAADIARIVSRHWLRAMPWENRERYWNLSPISKVATVTTPTLLMVGEEDWRTPTWEAEQFYTALKLQGVDTALIRIPGASHSIAARPSRLIGKVDNIMGWFEKYDPAKQEAAKAEDSDSATQ